jgi:uncharacterized membrane protein YhaH (DUF805 family)
MISWPHLLTSLNGRISRKPFWLALLGLSAIEIVAHLAMGERWSATVSLLLAYPEFALFAKRGHDRNVSAWVPGVFIAAASILNVLVLLDLVGTLAEPNTLFYVIGIPVGIMGLVLLIDFGFRRGTVGPNRYGPDPLSPA